MLASHESFIDPLTLEPATAQLYIYEPGAFGGDGRIAVAIGDLDTADHIAVTVPGLLSDAGGLDPDKSESIYAEARYASGDGVAVLDWMGYDAPSRSTAPGGGIGDEISEALDIAGVVNMSLATRRRRAARQRRRRHQRHARQQRPAPDGHRQLLRQHDLGDRRRRVRPGGRRPRAVGEPGCRAVRRRRRPDDGPRPHVGGQRQHRLRELPRRDRWVGPGRLDRRPDARRRADGQRPVGGRLRRQPHAGRVPGARLRTAAQLPRRPSTGTPTTTTPAASRCTTSPPSSPGSTTSSSPPTLATRTRSSRRTCRSRTSTSVGLAPSIEHRLANAGGGQPVPGRPGGATGYRATTVDARVKRGAARLPPARRLHRRRRRRVDDHRGRGRRAWAGTGRWPTPSTRPKRCSSPPSTRSAARATTPQGAVIEPRRVRGPRSRCRCPTPMAGSTWRTPAVRRATMRRPPATCSSTRASRPPSRAGSRRHRCGRRPVDRGRQRR